MARGLYQPPSPCAVEGCKMTLPARVNTSRVDSGVGVGVDYGGSESESESESPGNSSTPQPWLWETLRSVLKWAPSHYASVTLLNRSKQGLRMLRPETLINIHNTPARLTQTCVTDPPAPTRAIFPRFSDTDAKMAPTAPHPVEHEIRQLKHKVMTA